MTQSKSILFLTKLYHPHIGGVESHVEKISKMLIKKGYKVTILTENYNGDLKDKEILDKVRIVRIPVANNLFFKKFWIYKWVLFNISFFNQFEIIHIHDVFYWIYPIFPITFFKKIYITFHGYEGYPIKKKWIFHRKIAEKMTRGNICVGDFMKKWYFTNPTYVFYGGVRQVNIKMRPKRHSAVFFGRLDDQTGIKEYIKAYNLIKKTHPNFELTVVGEGELSKNIPKEVKVVGFSKNIDKFIASNRFIFVSRYLSMLEALVQKREVVATYNNPVKKDYISMSPFRDYVFASNSPQKMAEYVLKSLESGPDAQKLDSGFNWAKNQSWGKIVDSYLRLWNKNKV